MSRSRMALVTARLIDSADAGGGASAPSLPVSPWLRSMNLSVEFDRVVNVAEGDAACRGEGPDLGRNRL